jgi:basic membrane protein A
MIYSAFIQKNLDARYAIKNKNNDMKRTTHILLALSLLFSSQAIASDAGTPITFEQQTEAKPVIQVSAPAILFEINVQKTDKAFTEMAMKGAALANSERGIKYKEFLLQSGDDRETTLRKMAESGSKHVIAVGFENVLPVIKIAESFPHTKFTVIDGMVPPLYPNVRSVVFRDNEGGFLAGMLAAMASKSNVIGFVGGMDAPMIRNFAYGYEQGAHYIKSDIKVLRSMIGNTRESWNNPARGSALAEEQFSQGADVVFGCAGGSTTGVLLAAHKNNKLAIGIDSNQNNLFPGSVLTSLVKRVDKAVYDTLKADQENNWEPGTRYMGLSESALDYAVDMNNKSLVTKEMVDKVEIAKDMIIRGAMEVESYSPN